MARRKSNRAYPKRKKRQKGKAVRYPSNRHGGTLFAALCAAVLLCIAGVIASEHSLPMLDISAVSQSAEQLDLYEKNSACVVEPADVGETQLHFISVGQGDATLIAQDGAYALIDAGVSTATDDLLSYLHSLDIETIEVLVMTHPHSDHIGAMDEIIAEFEIETIILPQFDLSDELPTSTSFSNVLAAIEQSDATICVAEVGASYAVGSGTLTIVSAGIETDNLNDISVSTLFAAGDFSLLCTGDAEEAQEQAMLESGVSLHATVFQAGHHGSSTSNTLAFLQAVQPEFVVISCGLDNSYGHPHQSVLENYAAVGADYYRTDLDGTVVITYTAQDGIQVLCTQEQEAA